MVNEDRLTRLVRTFMADDADFETCVRSALDLMGSLESVDTIGIWRVEDGLVHQRFHWTAPTIPATLGEYRPFRIDEVEFARARWRGSRKSSYECPMTRSATNAVRPTRWPASGPAASLPCRW